jgi:hypothetical protein
MAFISYESSSKLILVRFQRSRLSARAVTYVIAETAQQVYTSTGIFVRWLCLISGQTAERCFLAVSFIGSAIKITGRNRLSIWAAGAELHFHF